MNDWAKGCCYTEGVDCDKAHTAHCDNCGFRPAVHRARAAKVRARLKQEEVKPIKKQRSAFTYPDRFETAEEVDDVQGTD